MPGEGGCNRILYGRYFLFYHRGFRIPLRLLFGFPAADAGRIRDEPGHSPVAAEP